MLLVILASTYLRALNSQPSFKHLLPAKIRLSITDCFHSSAFKILHYVLLRHQICFILSISKATETFSSYSSKSSDHILFSHPRRINWSIFFFTLLSTFKNCFMSIVTSTTCARMATVETHTFASSFLTLSITIRVMKLSRVLTTHAFKVLGTNYTPEYD